MATIGLIGIPIEDVPLIINGYCSYSISAYLPKITEKQRKAIITGLGNKGIEVTDLGEPKITELKPTKYSIDPLKGVPIKLLADEVTSVSLQDIENTRDFVLKRTKEFDLFVAIGPSHVGAIMLYEDGDKVARLDYHSDYSRKPYGRLIMNNAINNASYMDWVEHNIKDASVVNYFVRDFGEGYIFGGVSQQMDDHSYKHANHFDIDIDCLDEESMIRSVYRRLNGETGVMPETVIGMIREAKPRKLGIWEYRPESDLEGKGLEFIVNAIEAAI